MTTAAAPIATGQTTATSQTGPTSAVGSLTCGKTRYVTPNATSHANPQVPYKQPVVDRERSLGGASLGADQRERFLGAEVSALVVGALVRCLRHHVSYFELQTTLTLYRKVGWYATSGGVLAPNELIV